MKYIDLNCDLGEGTGNDALLMPLISSANIACGGHAGDASSMLACVHSALQHSVAIGAHPSYPDRTNFGRMESAISANELIELLVRQIRSLQSICASEGVELSHVKPHGALYNASAARLDVAEAVATAVARVAPSAVLFGLAGSKSLEAGRRAGLRVASEVFADRTYQPDGRLTPRTDSGALIENVQCGVQQVLRMIHHRTVAAVDGTILPIVAETVCIHGDGRNAVDFARTLRASLTGAGIGILPVSLGLHKEQSGRTE